MVVALKVQIHTRLGRSSALQGAVLSARVWVGAVEVWGTGTRGSGGQSWDCFWTECRLCTNSRGERQTEPTSSSALTMPGPGRASSACHAQAPSRQALRPHHRSSHLLLWRGSPVRPPCMFGIVQGHLCVALSPLCSYWSLSLVVVLREGNLEPGKLIQGLRLKISMSHTLAWYKSVQNHKS